MKMTTIFYDENKVVLKTLDILYHPVDSVEITKDMLYRPVVTMDEIKEDEIIRKIYLIAIQ